MKLEIRIIKVLLAVVFLILTNCINSDQIQVEVHNRSKDVLTDITVYASSRPDSNAYFVKKLKEGEMRSGFLDMKHTVGDGGYGLLFKRSTGIEESYGFGYYTNGSPLNRKVLFYIEPDTVLTVFE